MKEKKSHTGHKKKGSIDETSRKAVAHQRATSGSVLAALNHAHQTQAHGELLRGKVFGANLEVEGHRDCISLQQELLDEQKLSHPTLDVPIFVQRAARHIFSYGMYISSCLTPRRLFVTYF